MVNWGYRTIRIRYLVLKDGSVRYNCTVIDLYDHSVVSSINRVYMISDLAISEIKKAFASKKA